jgi:hypothetical protein
MWFRPALVVLAACVEGPAECPPDEPPPAEDEPVPSEPSAEAACEGLSGAWSSATERACGETLCGTTYCAWEITFADDGTFSWTYTDVSQDGTWTCADGVVTGADGETGWYEPDAGELVWEGVRYLRAE